MTCKDRGLSGSTTDRRQNPEQVNLGDGHETEAVGACSAISASTRPLRSAPTKSHPIPPPQVGQPTQLRPFFSCTCHGYSSDRKLILSHQILISMRLTCLYLGHLSMPVQYSRQRFLYTVLESQKRNTSYNNLPAPAALDPWKICPFCPTLGRHTY